MSGTEPLRVWTVVSVPCVHELRGHPHRSMRAIYECARRNGVPSFVTEEVVL